MKQLEYVNMLLIEGGNSVPTSFRPYMSSPTTHLRDDRGAQCFAYMSDVLLPQGIHVFYFQGCSVVFRLPKQSQS